MSMKRPSVFLCGPISGTDGTEALDWRAYAAHFLAPEIATIDPLRLPVSTKRWARAVQPEAERHARSQHGKAVLQKNRFDLVRADLVLANFLGAKDVSVGSVGELFWAHLLQKPVVVVRESERNPHDHAMLNEIAGWILGDLDEALSVVRTLIVVPAAKQ